MKMKKIGLILVLLLAGFITNGVVVQSCFIDYSTPSGSFG
ncbi:hypothetical protein ACVWXS_004552 [Lysinibacillus sp. TE18511]